MNEAMNEDNPKWWSFFAWPIVGAGLAFGILGLMTIGIFILPFAVVGLLALLKWGGNRNSSAGLISGVGLPIIYIAYLNRGGPGNICTPYGQGGQQCTQEWSPWPWLIIGLGLITLGVVVFLRLRRKAAHSSELGNDEALVATELIPHPLDFPIENRTRKLFAVGAAIWTMVGLISAVKEWGIPDQGANFFFFATVLLATLAGIGATAFALQGKRRATILSLFGSVLFPMYFVWELSLIPIVLACYLLFSPFISSFRNPKMRSLNIQVLSILGIAIILGLGWLRFHVDPMASTESKRVQQAFEQMSTTVSNKEGVPTPWLVPMHVGVASYSDGSKASLWVPMPSPQGIRLNCFYLDEPGVGGSTGYIEALCMKPMFDWLCTSGLGGQCIQPGKVVNLSRNGSIVVGSVGVWPARSVFVTTNGKTTRLPVKYGYFIVPGFLSEGRTTKFTITLLDSKGASLGTVLNLQASGSGAPQ